ncbi:unnamed protein product [Auanema sp. JU1783]|nr:unnamed protein product [Auanema sp. JU1783]
MTSLRVLLESFDGVFDTGSGICMNHAVFRNNMKTKFVLLSFAAFILAINCQEVEEEYEIFSQPLISEGEIYNQTMFEMEEDHERLCGKEGRLLKERGSYLVQCSQDSECLPPSQCNLGTGYCCMMALHQEPPPVGCPMGTRALRNSSGIELTCNPSDPNACPGGAMCYTDSLTQQRRCCGADPGQGCPSGSRIILNAMDDTPLLCTPGRTTCPRSGMCQWSHLIDRYQCCEPDNGCPKHQYPLKSAVGSSLKCSLGGPPCPGGASCRFNFWTSEYQCCRTDTADLCPTGQVPFLTESDSTPRSCKKDSQCPNGYHCSDNNVCCALPGSCPNTYSPMKDSFGRFTACSTRFGDTCPKGSTCLRSTIVSQSLCCAQVEHKCPDSALPYPNALNPQSCSFSNQWDCAEGQCMRSLTTGSPICCRSQFHKKPNPPSHCPSGWILPNNTPIYCSPNTFETTCPGYSSCLRSNLLQQHFICCLPAGQSPVLTSQGSNQICSTPGQQGACPFNSLCLGSSNSPNVYICCYSQGANVNPICPNNAIAQSSLTLSYVSCSIFTASCDPGYSCERASNDFNTMLCCSTSTNNAATCPNQQTLYLELGRPRYCLPSQPSACPSGYTCQLSVGTTGTYVCCTTPVAPTCPAQFTPSLDSRGASIFCSPAQPAGCPSGSVCLQANNDNSLFLCCRSASSPRVCPNNQNALLTPSASVETCSGPGSSCSRTGYTCVFSTVLAQYICCGNEQTNAGCANGYETFVQTSGQTFTCTPSSPTQCPFGYQCLISTVANVYVCCLPPIGTTTVFPTRPTDFLQCPTGWNPHRNAIDAQPRTCSSPRDTSCPVGYSCTPSSFSGVFICCRLATTMGCPIGTPFLLNNQPRLCSRNRANQCPRGYSCEQSTSPTITICCSTR